MVSHQIWYEENADALVDCILEVVPRLPDNASDSEVQAGIQVCMRPQLAKRGAVMLAGSVLVAGLGIGLMFLLPYRHWRRAGPITKAPSNWRERAAAVAAELGVRFGDDVQVAFGGVYLGVAFTVRHRRETWIVLPRGITTLSEPQAKAVLRHELAHLGAGDVTLVWLSAGLWLALVPILVLPVAVAAIQGGFVPVTFVRDMNLGWSEYALRSVVLFLLAGLVSLAILRTREHEADLSGPRQTHPDLVTVLLDHSPSRSPAWWRAPLAIHPNPKRRRDTIERPHLAARTPATDLIVVAFATTLTTAVSGTVGFQLGLFSSPVYQFCVVSVVQGLAITLTWALPAWRGALDRHPAGDRPPSVALPLLGMAVGVLIGLWVTEVNQDPSIRVTVPLATVGAGVLSLAASRLWAGWGSPHWGYVGALNVLLFSGAYWFGLNASTGGPGRSWIDRYWNAALMTDVLVPQALWVLAVSAFGCWWLMQARRTARIGPRLRATATTAAAVTATMLVAYYLAPPPANGAAGGYRLVATGVIAGVACLAALLLVSGPDGFGAALCAALVATTAVTIAVAVDHYGGLGRLVVPQPGLGAVVLAVLAPALLTVTVPLAILPGWRLPRPSALDLAAPPIAVVIAVALLVLVPAPSWVAPPRPDREAQHPAQLWTATTPFETTTGLTFTPDGSRLVSGGIHGRTGSVVVWDARSGRRIGPPMAEGAQISDIALSPDGKRLAVARATTAGSTELWDLETRTRVARVWPKTSWGVRFNRDGSLLAMSVDDGVALWSAATGVVVHLTGQYGRYTEDVVFSPDERYVVSAGNETIQVWDWRTERESKPPLRGHSACQVREIGFAAVDGTPMLVSSCEDSTVRLWDFAGRRQERELAPYQRNIRDMAVSPDGQRVAIWTPDGIEWRATDGYWQDQYEFRTNAPAPTCMRFGPDGQVLAVGEGSTIRLYQAPA